MSAGMFAPAMPPQLVSEEALEVLLMMTTPTAPPARAFGTVVLK